MPDPSSKHRQRGAALVFFLLMLIFVILPLIGLCIDGGFTYYAHARLMSAADAAALAGARSLNVGMDFASQKAHAEAVAAQYFAANFPKGLLGSSNPVVNAQAAETSNHTRTVTVNVSTDVPLAFLGILGFKSATINGNATTSRRDVNLVLALDRSGSMSGVCDVLKADAQSFVSMFTNNRDTVGLVTFMGNAGVDYPSTLQFKSKTPSLNDTLAKLKCGNTTGSAAAITLAHQQITGIALPGALNVIVFFTDGVPNGFRPGPATTGAKPGLPIKSGVTCNSGKPVDGTIAQSGGIYDPTPQAISSTSAPYLDACGTGRAQSMTYTTMGTKFSFIPETDFWGNTAGSGYATVARSSGHITFTSGNSDAVSQNAAVDAALKARQEGIFIYVIGLDGNGGVDDKLLKRIANDPTGTGYNSTQPAGKYYYAPNAGQLAAAFYAVASETLRLSM